MSWDELMAWLAAMPPDARDDEIDRYLGLGEATSAAPGAEMIGYHASGLAPIVRALCEAPVGPTDVLFDLGAGLGKVVALAERLATARGIEIQPALAARARQVCRSEIVTADVREVDLAEGTVFFLYLPFTGSVMRAVVDALGAVAADHPIVVCALGAELRASFLRARPTESFWMTIYDSGAPRPARALTAAERAVAFEAPLAEGGAPSA